MTLNIESLETEAVVRELAKRTGKSITDAIHQAASEKLRQMDADYAERVARLTPEQLVTLRRLEEISRRGAALPILDTRTEDEILGYNERGTFD